MSLDELRQLVGRECFRLAKLGSANAIAAELASRGMQGVQEDQRECPLARGLCDTLMCSTGRLQVTAYDVLWNDHWMVSLKEGLAQVRVFVENFDRGLYPHLIQD